MNKKAVNIKFKIPAVLFFLCYAGYSQNNLSLSSSDGKAFKVLLNKKVYNEIPQAHVVVEKITQDTLRLEIEYENRKRFPVTVYFLERGLSCSNKEFDYRLEYGDVKLNTRFSGVYDIHPLQHPIVPVKPVLNADKAKRNVVSGHLCELKEGKLIYFNNIPQAGGCETAMPAEYLSYVARLMENGGKPANKYEIIENVCRNNCLSVAQLSALLNYIDYEIEKMAIVRLAYYNVVDPQNRKQLEKSFSFNASINELNIFFKTADESPPGAARKCESAASQMLIDRYCEKLAAFSNDTERYEALQKGYAEICYSSLQIAQILNKFSHDREKLESAKLLFPYCVDKDKFVMINGLFSYNQSVKELQEFINKQRR